MIGRTSKEFREIFLLLFTKELINQFAPKEIPKQELKQVPRRMFPIQLRPRKKILRIPKTKLPPHLQYLKPSPTKNLELDFPKLDLLIKDPLVREIECNGADKRVLVRGVMGAKKTNILLTKEEIDEIIQKFSKVSKIPVHDGLFKVVAGRFIFSAIVSKVAGSRFIIKKMVYDPMFRR